MSPLGAIGGGGGRLSGEIGYHGFGALQVAEVDCGRISGGQNLCPKVKIK